MIAGRPVTRGGGQLTRGLLMYGMGPTARRVLDDIRGRIESGELQPGARLPAHTELAEKFGVAPLTVRQVLASLEADGLVSRQQGRGTFVLKPVHPAVLVVDDDPSYQKILGSHVEAAGHRALVAGGPDEALAALESDDAIRLVLSDIRMPAASDGVGFIREVRRRWPDIPVAAVTGYPEDMGELFGSPECPVLVLAKPFRATQVEEAIRLAMGTPSQRETEAT